MQRKDQGTLGSWKLGSGPGSAVPKDPSDLLRCSRASWSLNLSQLLNNGRQTKSAAFRFCFKNKILWRGSLPSTWVQKAGKGAGTSTTRSSPGLGRQDLESSGPLDLTKAQV